MKLLILLSLVAFSAMVKGRERDKVEEEGCEALHGQCISNDITCHSMDIIHSNDCPTDKKCCARPNLETGDDGLKRLDKCEKKEKCNKKGGKCKEECGEQDKITKGCSKKEGCKCCVPECKAKKKCTEAGGFCVKDATQCNGSLKKGCEGKGCYCCVESDEVCNLQKDPGSGRASFLRYYYNVEYRLCLTFTWGGLDGNANRFKTYEECLKKCGGSPVPIPDGPGGHFTTIKINPYECNDNYESWQKEDAKLSFSDAVAFCSRSNNRKLACPLNDESFIKWIRNEKFQNEFWFNGKQGGNAYNFNYVFWQSGYEISKNINGQRNMWLPTYPNYMKDGSYCVKGMDSLSTDDCTTAHSFFCSNP